MGLILSAACRGCGYQATGLRLGATRDALEEHDVQVEELFPVLCCGEVQSIRISLGAPLPRPDCARCGTPLELTPDSRYRIARLSGDVLEGHPCPRCEAPQLGFAPLGTFE